MDMGVSENRGGEGHFRSLSGMPSEEIGGEVWEEEREMELDRHDKRIIVMVI